MIVSFLQTQTRRLASQSCWCRFALLGFLHYWGNSPSQLCKKLTHACTHTHTLCCLSMCDLSLPLGSRKQWQQYDVVWYSAGLHWLLCCLVDILWTHHSIWSLIRIQFDTITPGREVLLPLESAVSKKSRIFKTTLKLFGFDSRAELATSLILFSHLPHNSCLSVFFVFMILPPSSPSSLRLGWRWRSSLGCYPFGCARLFPLLVDIRYWIYLYLGHKLIFFTRELCWQKWIIATYAEK